MDDRFARQPVRYRVFLAVLAFHAGVIALLIMSSDKLHLSVPLLDVAFLPPDTSRRVRADAPPSPPLDRTRVNPSLDATLTLSPQPVPALGNSGVPIDWARQAEVVADAVVANGSAPDGGMRSDLTPPQKSVFPDLPAHHAGEQHRLDTGEWMVFVSDTCYQIAATLSTVAAASGNGMGEQTYCLGSSDTPRGDLFDQLPAYWKYRHRGH